MDDTVSGGAFQAAQSVSVATRVCAMLLIIALVAGIRAYFWLVPGYLLQPVSPDLIAFCIFFGVLAALAIVYVWVMRLRASAMSPKAGQVLTIVAVVWLVGYRLPIMAASASVQIASFAAFSPSTHVMQLTVTGTHYDWWAKRGAYHIDARLADTGYVVSLPATQDGYNAASVGNSISLPVETGQNGIRRIVMAHRLGLPELRPS
jgi:hypothetical protein